jgi:hypothetical protein
LANGRGYRERKGPIFNLLYDKPMFWILLILLFVGVCFFWLMRSGKSEYLDALRNKQLSIVEQYGTKILQNIDSISSVNSFNQSTTGQPVRWEPRSPSPKAKSLLCPELIQLRDRVLAIMAGTYRLDESTISYLRINLDYILTYLLQNKIKTGSNILDASAALTESYNPSSNNDLVLEACRDLMHYQPISDSKRIFIAQYIANRSGDGDEIHQIYDWITGLVSDATTPHALRAEAADMLMLTNNSRYMKIARDALEQLRREEDVLPVITPLIPERVRPEAPRPAGIHGIQLPLDIPAWLINQQGALIAGFEARQPKINRTVHEDGQNVHNTEINNSVLEAAANIIKANKTLQPFVFDSKLTKDLTTMQKAKIDSALHRISTDSTSFKHGTTLYGLFQSLQSFIDSNPNKQELNKRLVEELTDMSGQCATGHLARLVNVVQGFEAAPQQKIRMNIADEVYARLSHSLTQALQKPENSAAADAIVMGDDPKAVKQFVAAHIDQMAPELVNEYKDIANPAEVKKQLIAAAKTYTKDESFIV